jgi:hypothetical protein
MPCFGSQFENGRHLENLMSRIYSPDIKKFLAVAIFKMAAKIQHCPISSKFDMWVDNDVPNLFLTLENF